MMHYNVPHIVEARALRLYRVLLRMCARVPAALSRVLQGLIAGAIDQVGNLVVTWWDARRGLTNASGSLLLEAQWC